MIVYMYWFDTQRHKLPHFYVRYQGAEAVFGLNGGRKGNPMGSANPVILRVTTPEYGRVVVEASDGLRYSADLSALSRVYCYPRDRAAWDQVAPDSHGLALVWTSRFEVHVDQVIALAEKIEPVQKTA